MNNTVNVIVTCTNNKRFSVPKELKLRSIEGSRIDEKVKNWIHRLQSNDSQSVPAIDLYSGDHWNVVKGFSQRAQQVGIIAKIWIVSAGYGLIKMSSFLKPYAATFSPGSPDSIGYETISISRSVANQEWWEQLSQWEGPDKKEPRTIAEIAKKEPDTPVLVAVSAEYLTAFAKDLELAARHLQDRDFLSIVSSGTSKYPTLNYHLIPCDARLLPLIGGVRGSLNVRVTSKILSEANNVPIKVAVLKSHYEQLLEEQGPIIRYDRQPMSDDEVKHFIREELRTNRSQKHTPLLRKLRRERQKACEQSRFKNLYQVVWEELYDAKLI